MKKNLIILLFVLVCFTGNQIANKSEAAELTANELDSIEQLFFNQTYSNDSIEKRLDKIENIIYGQTFDQMSTSDRMEKLTPFVPNNIQKQASNSSPPPQAQRRREPKAALSPIKSPKRFDDVPGLISSIPADYLDGTLPPRRETVFTEENNNINTQSSRDFQPIHPDAATSESKEDLAKKYGAPNQEIASLPAKRDFRTFGNPAPQQPQNNQYSQQNQNNNIGETENDNTDYNNYPAVDEMEESLFGQAYPTENIYKRLERIEIQLTGTKQPGSLYDRVNNLSKHAKYNQLRQKFSQQYTPVNPAAPSNAMASSYTNSQSSSNQYDPSNRYYSEQNTTNGISVGVQRPSSNYQSDSGHPQQVMVGASIGGQREEIAAIENGLFGQTYENDLTLSRLDRIEEKVFGSTNFGSPGPRIKKIKNKLEGKNSNIILSRQAPMYPTLPNYGYPNYPGYNQYNPYNNYMPPVQQNYYDYNNGYNQPYNQPYNQSYNQPYNQPYNQSYNQPYNQGYNQMYNNYPVPGYGYAPALPMTPGSVAKSAANAALQNTVGKKGGILSKIGQVAGNMLMGGGVPYANYATSGYGYGGYGY